MTLAEHSWCYRTAARFASGSRVAAWWQAPGTPTGVCAGSVALAALRGAGGLWWAVASVAFLYMIAALPEARFGLCLLFGVGVAAFVWPVAGLAALPLAHVWSPRWPVWHAGDEWFFLRVDHALVVAVTLHLVVRGRLRDTRPYVPLLLFLSVAGISGLVGTVRQTAPAPALTLAYYAQLVQLGLVLVAAYSLGGRLGSAGLYAWVLAVISVAAYGIAEDLFPLGAVQPGVYRTYERLVFDGQANHMAGLLAVGAVVGLALVREPRWRVLGMSLAALSCAALPGTHSREGAVALIVALGCLALVMFPRYSWPLIPFGLLLAMVVPATVWGELSAPGTSLFSRLVHWQGALGTVADYPVLGLGLGARHRQFYDNQYVMFLAETGGVGALFFVGWLAYLARALWQGRRAPGVGGALCAGALAGLAGVAVQGLAAVCFIVTVLAGPLYWLAGYALSQADEGS